MASISGFANSEGGVLVWGVRADQQQPDEPDVAKELKPIRSLRAFLSDLWSFTPQLVVEALPNVVHQEFEIDGQKDTGYIVSYIPKSDNPRPHMNISAQEGRYYYRSGSGFVKMEHFMIAGWFARRLKPNLKFTWELSRSMQDRAVDLIIGIENIGEGIALYPALSIHTTGWFSPNIYGLDGNYNQGLPRRILAHDRKDPLTFMFAGGVDHAIHPGTHLAVARFSCLFPQNDYKDEVLTYALYCDGFTEQGQVILPVNDILKNI